METNWYGLTVWQHLGKMFELFFLTPFKKSFWSHLFEHEEAQPTFNFVGYTFTTVVFMFMGFSIIWIMSPILFPVTTIVSRIILVKKSRQLVIDALTSK